MRAQHGILGINLFDTLAAAEAYSLDGSREAAKLAQVLQILIHLLVADYGQSKVVIVFLLGVLVQNLFGKGVEVDGDAIICFLGGDVQDAILNVVPSEIGHIRIPERGEGAEAK